jgi:hypothetical protein
MPHVTKPAPTNAHTKPANPAAAPPVADAASQSQTARDFEMASKYYRDTILKYTQGRPLTGVEWLTATIAWLRYSTAARAWQDDANARREVCRRQFDPLHTAHLAAQEKVEQMRRQVSQLESIKAANPEDAERLRESLRIEPLKLAAAKAEAELLDCEAKLKAVQEPAWGLWQAIEAELTKATACVGEAATLKPLRQVAEPVLKPETLAHLAAARLPAIPKRSEDQGEDAWFRGAVDQAHQLLRVATAYIDSLRGQATSDMAYEIEVTTQRVRVADIIDSYKNGGLPLLPARKNRNGGSLGKRAVQDALQALLSPVEHQAFTKDGGIPPTTLERLRWQRWLGEQAR